MLIHVCNGHMTIRFSIFDYFKHFFWTGYESFGGTFYERHTIFILMHTQIHFGHVKQISNFVQINFIIGDFDVKLKIYFHTVNMIEDVVHNPRNYALFCWVTYEWKMSIVSLKSSTIEQLK